MVSPPVCLHVFGAPHLRIDGQRIELPASAPTWLLLALALHEDGWMARERLAMQLWPEAATAEAQHHLRVTLHRSRSLLASAGQVSAVVAERTRLRLVLPSDVAAFRSALAAGDWARAVALQPAPLPSGETVRGFAAFADTLVQQRERLSAAWRNACIQQAAALADGGKGHAAAELLLQALERQPLAEDLLLPVLRLAADGCRVADAQLAWRRLQHGLRRDDNQPLPQTVHLAARLQAVVAPAPAAAPLAGRVAEWQAVVSCDAAALLLDGEPGIGKTTLLRRALPGALRLQGREGLDGLPYRVLAEALRPQLGVLREHLRADTASTLAPYRLDLARLWPELVPDEPLPPLDAASARLRLSEALARAAETLARVLVIDDLQWCDAATVAWLGELALRGSVRWRATARAGELPADTLRVLDGLARAGVLVRQTLQPLDREALAAALAEDWPVLARQPARLHQLHAASGGNPFAARALLDLALAPDAPLPQQALALATEQILRAPPAVRAAVQASAVLVEPVPRPALQAIAGEAAGLACADAVALGLMRVRAGRYQCSHDLIRQAARQVLAPTDAQALHQAAARWLGTQADTDPLTVAAHWRAAGLPAGAWDWCAEAARRLKAQGRFDEALAQWLQVIEGCDDVARLLNARIEAAALRFFDDLAASRVALEAVAVQLDAVDDERQRLLLRARVQSALVDNQVFSGDLAAARGRAQWLESHWQQLPDALRVDVCEVMLELTMREGDEAACWAWHGRLRRLAPRRWSVLSFEGQIHWFYGRVPAARDALLQLLRQHPECRTGITVENDLAVMQQALGELDAAEVMARASLRSWAGVAHTETLSLLVLGLTLTSGGRHDEAQAALEQALCLAQAQRSAGFEAEARVRLARLHLAAGRPADAAQALQRAAPTLRGTVEALRASQWAQATVEAAVALGQAIDPAVPAVMRAAAARSTHPLVHCRSWRVTALQAWAGGDTTGAVQAAQAEATLAHAASLPQVQAEALALSAMWRAEGDPAAAADADTARALAQRHGFAALRIAPA